MYDILLFAYIPKCPGTEFTFINEILKINIKHWGYSCKGQAQHTALEMVNTRLEASISQVADLWASLNISLVKFPHCMNLPQALDTKSSVSWSSTAVLYKRNKHRFGARYGFNSGSTIYKLVGFGKSFHLWEPNFSHLNVNASLMETW